MKLSTTPTLPSSPRITAGLTILRTVAGFVFMIHGVRKFIFGLAGVSGAFAGLGVPLPDLLGPAVAMGELVGGLALMFGMFTRFAAGGLATVMLGAIVFVHLPAGFFAPDGIEFVLTLFAAAVAIALTGPGPLSIDAALERRKKRAGAGA